MKGSEWLASIPQSKCAERESAIIDAVKAGRHRDVLQFSPILTTFNGYKGTLLVGSDVLAFGEQGDIVRANVTAATAQTIADMCDWVLPTTKICDLIWQSADVKIQPCLQPADPKDRAKEGFSPSMMDTAAMGRHSADIDRLVAQRLGLVENAGKQWVLSNHLLNHPKMAANYGFYDSGAPYRSVSGLKMWQTLGFGHNYAHCDYSQTLRPVKAMMLVDDQYMRIVEVASDPDLWGLVSDEGPLKLARLPGTGPDAVEPEAPPLVVGLLRFGRDLRRGCYGPDVADWQAFLKLVRDQKFGPITEQATRTFQSRSGLKVDGWVGPKTVAAANREIAELSNIHKDKQALLIDSFIQAKNYTPVRGAPRKIKNIVLHTAEIAEKPNAAEALAAWASGPKAPAASWHFGVDSDSIAQCVREEDIAWQAPGCNGVGIGIEMAGWARQTAEEWFDDYSRDMLIRTSALVRYLCDKYQIPVKYVGAEALKRGEKGITTHVQVSRAFRKSDHVDPGANFPMDWFLEQVLDAQ